MPICWYDLRQRGTILNMPKSHPGRRYDLWWKDPFRYSNELVASGESQVMLDFGKLYHYRLNPRGFMRERFAGMPWKCYVVHNDFVYLIDHTCESEQIKGSWPIWDYERYDLKELQDYVSAPWLGRPVPPDARWWEIPQVGQQHRVFINDIVAGAQGDTKNRARRQRLTKIQKLFPEVELFIISKWLHFPLMFGSGFDACGVDVKATLLSNKRQLFLPNGSQFKSMDAAKYRDEIEYFGFDYRDVRDDHEAAMLFTIAVMRYAAHHWDDETGPFYSKNGRRRSPDFNNPDMYAEMPSYERIPGFYAPVVKETDKIVCDSCSLWRKCPSYRAEEVCGLGSSDSRRLADMAMSRNADDVVEMLASIVSKQADRVEKRLEDEKFSESGHDKEVDKMLNSVFKNGVQLAKLRDPSLGRPLVQINANVQQAKAVESSDPRALAMGVIQEIEATGVKREDITEEMIQDHITKNYAPKQLESEVVDAEVEDE